MKRENDSQLKDDVDFEQRVVLDLDTSAREMATCIRKYPRGGKMFHRTRERFVSVIPSQQGVTPLQRWQRGSVAYWKDKADFSSHMAPLGHMNLLRITKVRHLDNVNERDGRGVMIVHMPKSDVQEVVFVFNTRDGAREFSYALRAFIADLRSTLDEAGIRKEKLHELVAQQEQNDDIPIYISI
jgi:hypothetical protein